MFYCGLDLGQTTDPSVAVILDAQGERLVLPIAEHANRRAHMIERDPAQLWHAWLGGWQLVQVAGETEGRPIVQPGLIPGLGVDLGVGELRSDILAAVQIHNTEHAVLIGDDLIHGRALRL